MGCFSRGKPGGDKAIPARCLVLFIPLINQEEKAFSSLGLGRKALGTWWQGLKSLFSTVLLVLSHLEKVFESLIHQRLLGLGIFPALLLLWQCGSLGPVQGSLCSLQGFLDTSLWGQNK